MTTTHFTTTQAPRSAAGFTASTLHTVAAGAAVRLTAPHPMALRISEGQAWVTLGTGEITHGDVFLCAGQALALAAGQQVVVEPLNNCRLQYRWTRQEAGSSGVAASWWQRAALGNPRQAPDGLGDACWA